MTSEVLSRATDDVVIEMNKIEQSPDAVDAPRRQQNVISFYHSKKSTAEGMMDISFSQPTPIN